jgi:glucosamine-6-phosphate deaminase
MKWVVVDDYQQLSVSAAKMLLDTLDLQPDLVLGLPTGRTPEGMYGNLVAACSRRYHCFGDVTTFNLDEYVGIPPEHPGSYYSYMKRHLFDHVDIDPRHVNIPDGMATRVRAEHPELSFDETLEVECQRYEVTIHDAGGIDLTFLGLGRNGHIGFNEPGTSFDSRTHVIRLSESTRIANADLFADGHVPERAITMGIGTILESRAIVLMASGAAKAEAVRTLSESEPDSRFPASGLKNHGNTTVLVDRAAAAHLDGIEFAIG